MLLYNEINLLEPKTCNRNFYDQASYGKVEKAYDLGRR